MAMPKPQANTMASASSLKEAHGAIGVSTMSGAGACLASVGLVGASIDTCISDCSYSAFHRNKAQSPFTGGKPGASITGLVPLLHAANPTINPNPNRLHATNPIAKINPHPSHLHAADPVFTTCSDLQEQRLRSPPESG